MVISFKALHNQEVLGDTSFELTTIDEFDKIMDAFFSNFKISLLFYIRKYHPELWHASSPIEHDKLNTLQFNG